MTILLYLVPIALTLGAAGLAAFMWSLCTGQYDDLDGAALAPRPAIANLPYALTLLGAAIASLPASMLLDQFGRRAAFALGACLGTSGGILAAFAIATQQFGLLSLGALWIGIAQGFTSSIGTPLLLRRRAARARR